MPRTYDVYFARMALTLEVAEREALQRALAAYQRGGQGKGFSRYLVDEGILDAGSCERVTAELERWIRSQRERESGSREARVRAAKGDAAQGSTGQPARVRETPATAHPRAAAPREPAAPAETSRPAFPGSSGTAHRGAATPPPPQAAAAPAPPPREGKGHRRSGVVSTTGASDAPAAAPAPQPPPPAKRSSARIPAPPADAPPKKPADASAKVSEADAIRAKQWALYDNATRDPLTKLVGRRLGRTELTRLVSSGEVVAIFDGQFGEDERAAIVKVFRPERSKDKVGLERFQREALALAKIDHPNIARVLETGTAEGVRYLSVEAGGGEPLSGLLERGGRLAPERVVRIARGVALGLAAAHRAGIVHRDVRPANVLVEEGGGVKLVGFGVARDVAVPGRLTATGTITGHPSYSAPELATAEEVTGKADVYSLGVVLFLALAGRLPFESRSVVKLVALHLNSPVPDLEAVAPGCPSRLAAVVKKLLAKDAKSRPEAMEAATLLAAKDLLEVPKAVLPAAEFADESRKPDTEEELRRAMATDEHESVELGAEKDLGGPACAACELPLGAKVTSLHGNPICEKCLERVEALDLCAACLHDTNPNQQGVAIFGGHVYCAACTGRVRLPCGACRKDVVLSGLVSGQARAKGEQIFHSTCSR